MNEWITIGESYIRIKDIATFYPYKDKLIIIMISGDDYAIDNTEENLTELKTLLIGSRINIKATFKEWESK